MCLVQFPRRWAWERFQWKRLTYWERAVGVKLIREGGKKKRSSHWCGCSWSLSSVWMSLQTCPTLRQEDWSWIPSYRLVTIDRCGGRHRALNLSGIARCGPSCWFRLVSVQMYCCEFLAANTQLEDGWTGLVKGLQAVHQQGQLQVILLFVFFFILS